MWFRSFRLKTHVVEHASRLNFHVKLSKNAITCISTSESRSNSPNHHLTHQCAHVFFIFLRSACKFIKISNGEASSAETATIRAFAKGAEQVKHQIPSGTGGKLRLHKSGKLTMTLGNIVMEVNQGTESNFLQDVVVMNEEEKRAYLIGQIARKMVVSPDITQISSS